MRQKGCKHEKEHSKNNKPISSSWADHIILSMRRTHYWAPWIIHCKKSTLDPSRCRFRLRERRAHHIDASRRRSRRSRLRQHHALILRKPPLLSLDRLPLTLLRERKVLTGSLHEVVSALEQSQPSAEFRPQLEAR